MSSVLLLVVLVRSNLFHTSGYLISWSRGTLESSYLGFGSHKLILLPWPRRPATTAEVDLHTYKILLRILRWIEKENFTYAKCEMLLKNTTPALKRSRPFLLNLYAHTHEYSNKKVVAFFLPIRRLIHVRIRQVTVSIIAHFLQKKRGWLE